MKPHARDVDGTMNMPVTEDARAMCFAQGKSCVYASDDDRFIISETPAGVIDRHERRTGQVTRFWPDGTIRRRWHTAQENLAKTAHAFRRIDLYDNSGTTYRQIAIVTQHGIEQVSRETPRWARKLLERIDDKSGRGRAKHGGNTRRASR